MKNKTQKDNDKKDILRISLISGGILLGIALLIVYGIYTNNIDKEAPFITVEDVSKDCKSNSLVIYYDSEYKVLKPYVTTPFQKRVIISGELKDYGHKELDNLVKTFDKYTIDDATYMNYKITLQDGKEITVAMADAIELNKLIGQIPLENLFWCS